MGNCKNHKEWTLSDVKFIQENMHLKDRELAIVLETTVTSVQAFRLRFGLKKEYKFKPGNKMCSLRKTLGNSFKPGNVPANARPLYEVYIETNQNGKQYKFIKLPEHFRYPYGRYVYEQHHNVKLSKKDVIWFTDCNPLNCVPENLEKITRQQVARRNYDGKKAGETNSKNWKELKATLADCGIELKQRKIA